MRLKLIACEVLRREFEHLIAHSPNEVEPLFLEKGLHDLGSQPMRQRLQAAIDAVVPGFDAVLLGYGLCNNGTAGLVARDTTLVIPRAHDCITLLMGSRERYDWYFAENPGTYFLSTGWIEHEGVSEDLRSQTIPARMGMECSLEDLIEKYGEEEGRYVWEALSPTRNYRQITFIETGVEPDGTYEAAARDRAADHGWSFEKLRGDLSLFRRLLDGPWDDADFLTVPPGCTVEPDYGGKIVRLASTETRYR
ncbi:MAG: DUF1638 domain-containing protein [Fimbriimonadia bacterium]|jgi:hypothetical protein